MCFKMYVKIFKIILFKKPRQDRGKGKKKETQNNCVHAQLGQVLDNKIQKDQKNSTITSEDLGAKSWVLEEKAGYCACPLHSTLPRGGQTT